VGRARPVSARFSGLPHEMAGARFCAGILPPRVPWLVAAHVPAKRYLVATDPLYRDALSSASVRSLEAQGGAMDPDEVDAFASHPWAEHAVALRRWDEAAKHPGAEAPALDRLLAYVHRVERISSTGRVDR
jgi:predicted HD phosphohydrolase